jgi:hypothetical protein
MDTSPRSGGEIRIRGQRINARREMRPPPARAPGFEPSVPRVIASSTGTDLTSHRQAPRITCLSAARPPSQSVGRDARYPELPQHAEPPPLSYTPSAAPASSSTGSSCSGSRPARQRRWARSPTNGAGARVTRGDGRHEHVAGTDRRRDCSRPRVRRRRVIGGIAPETGQKPETTAFGQ